MIDLLAWNEAAVKQMTCDNLHLTKAGSDYLYDAICERMKISGTPVTTPPTSGISSNGALVNASSETGGEHEEVTSGNRKMLVIGNGPSTKALAEFGFQNLPDDVDTFGMRAAYRYFRKVGWWPKY